MLVAQGCLIVPAVMVALVGYEAADYWKKGNAVTKTIVGTVNIINCRQLLRQLGSHLLQVQPLWH
jgi:hypothetical protein